MAKRNEGLKPGKGSRKCGGSDHATVSRPYNDDDLIRALNHPLRREVLRLLQRTGGPLSPVEMAAALELGPDPKEDLSNVSYHTTVLRNCGVVRETDKKQVRGALQHFFVSEVADREVAVCLLASTEMADKAKLWPGRAKKGRKKSPKKKGSQR